MMSSENRDGPRYRYHFDDGVPVRDEIRGNLAEVSLNSEISMSIDTRRQCSSLIRQSVMSIIASGPDKLAIWIGLIVAPPTAAAASTKHSREPPESPTRRRRRPSNEQM
ncbi:hypothetical protein OSTOST_15122, partial [Ostertagia ostertagi]